MLKTVGENGQLVFARLFEKQRRKFKWRTFRTDLSFSNENSACKFGEINEK